MAAVSVPVMAKVRLGHFAEAQILQAIGVDMIDESEGTCKSVRINHIKIHHGIHHCSRFHMCCGDGRVKDVIVLRKIKMDNRNCCTSH